MRLTFCLGFAILFFLRPENEVVAQVYGSNIFEAQYGNLPFEENRELATAYDQLNLYYDYGKFTAYGRLEQFLSQPYDRNYFQLTQKRIQYEDELFKIRVGNFYETLGRGLLLRSYEIPGSVYEDRFYRTRYAFNRDLEGAAVDYTGDRLEGKILVARPLYNILPPNIEPDSLRRPDLIQALKISTYLSENENVRVGALVFRSASGGESRFEEYVSIDLSVNTPFDLQLYSEYAADLEDDFLSLKKDEVYALYTGLNYFKGSFGASLEYKNYSRFILGSGFNNPPSLIKEHTYPVLNRSTHVMDALNESGFQLELFYNFKGGHSLVANYTTAVNDIGETYNYREYFLEGTYQASDLVSVKAFLDYATDELYGEEDRVSAGIVTEKSFDYVWSLSLDLQYQSFQKSFNPGRDNRNYYTSLSFSYLPDLIVSAVFEASTDLALTDNPGTFEVEDDTRVWLGGNVRYKINRSHTLDIFAGKRRGGPACTSGICYEVLDFEGVEVSLSTRF